MTIDGPLGPFQIPESAHPRTREVCELLTRQVFGDATTPGEYDHPELPRNVKMILDIGAGWGAFSIWAFAKWPQCMIDAYEPHREAGNVWLQNIEVPNRVGIAILHRVAVTTNPAPRLNGCEDWGSYGVTGEGGWPVEGKHPQYLPPCDVLKVDCEGCEVEVLEHYPHLVKCAALLVEYHSPALRQRVFELAEAAGFRCVKQPPDDASYGVTVWVRS